MTDPLENLGDAMLDAYPELALVAEAAEAAPVYLVGGAVRDLLLGRGRSDLDLVVVGEAARVAKRLGVEVVEHDRFATAKAQLDGHLVDIASARSETYTRPGALPEVEPADDIAIDLGRRDFTINAMAVPLLGEPRLMDPHGGRSDLDSGTLRVLHPRSLADDPTRALRAARYAARFGFEPEPGTLGQLLAADLSTVSMERRESDLLRLAAEPDAQRGFELLREWGLIEPRAGGIELAAALSDLLSTPPWRDVAPRERVLLAAAIGPAGSERELVAAAPRRPSEAVELARGRDPIELALARGLGAEWLDRYLLEWSGVQLEIGGGDLIAAGVPEGPAVGRGLAAALRRKLDGEVAGRQEELEVAVRAAREGPS